MWELKCPCGNGLGIQSTVKKTFCKFYANDGRPKSSLQGESYIE